MKLVIMIPCFNEELNIKRVIESIPTKLDGITDIQILVLDDGSSDQSNAIAKSLGVHVLRNKINIGLARTFQRGLKKAIEIGADIIVNIDADGQYQASEIPSLILPILEEKADFVIGDRQISKLDYLPSHLKFLQKKGSQLVSFLARKHIPDAPSGFRAFSRECASKLNIITYYTYTLETVLHASDLGFSVLSVPIEARKVDRKSRLMKNKFEYIIRSVITLFRVFTYYNPFRVFSIISLIFFIFAAFLGIRFIVLGTSGHIQSLILCAILSISGIITLLAGVFADLIQGNRKILEEIKFKMN